MKINFQGCLLTRTHQRQQRQPPKERRRGTWELPALDLILTTSTSRAFAWVMEIVAGWAGSSSAQLQSLWPAITGQGTATVTRASPRQARPLSRTLLGLTSSLYSLEKDKYSLFDWMHPCQVDLLFWHNFTHFYPATRLQALTLANMVTPST